MKSIFSNISSARELHFRKRELILRDQDILQYTYYIKNGYVRNYTITNSGRELTLAILKKGDIFSLETFLGRTQNNYFFETLNNTTVLVAPSDEVVKQISNSLSDILYLNSEILTRFYGVLERLQFLAFGSAHSKVASIIVICAERFGEIQSDRTIRVMAPLTHNDIASLVGLARETVSIEMKQLQSRGYIEYSGRSKIIVKNISKLRSFAMKGL